MQNYDFLNSVMHPAFVMNQKTQVIHYINEPFQKTFGNCLLNEGQSVPSSLRTLILKIGQRMDGLDAAVFMDTLVFPDGEKEIYVKCQIYDGTKEQLIVELDTEARSTMLPLESSITAQLIPGGILVIELCEKQFHVRYANDSLYQMLGYSHEECTQMSNSNLFDFIYEEDRSPGYVKYVHQIAEGGQFYIDGRMKCKGGILKWVNFSGKRISGPDGKTLLFAVITDISDSLRLREELYLEKQSFSALEHVSKNIVFRYDVSSDEVTFSGNLLFRLTGKSSTTYTVNELSSGKTILSLDAAQIKKIVRSVKSGKKSNYVFKVMDHSKNKYWLCVDYFFVRRQDNIDVSIVGEITDVTESVNAKTYYDKAILLWSTKQDDCAEAMAINISTGVVISGHSTLHDIPPIGELDEKTYLKIILKSMIDEETKKRIKTDLLPKNLHSAFQEGRTHFSYEVELNRSGAHDWYRLSLSLLKNPKSKDLIALFKWNDINNVKLQQQINHLLFYNVYDFVCCIFAKTDSFAMMSNFENNTIIPDSVSCGYEAYMSNTIEKYALPDDKSYLNFCFSLKNLVSQLSVSQNYSFVGHGKYPDGSPTVKFHNFSYLNEEKQIILYTRKDITSKAEVLTFKSNNSVCNVPFRDIVYLESFGKKSTIVTKQCKYEVNEMLSSIQERLPGREFMRCHRCYIVRYDAVQKIDKYLATLSNGDEVSISRNYIDLLRKRINPS